MIKRSLSLAALAGATILSLTLLGYAIILWTWGLDRFVIMFLGLALMASGVTVYLYRLQFIDQRVPAADERQQEVQRVSESGSFGA